MILIAGLVVGLALGWFWRSRVESGKPGEIGRMPWAAARRSPATPPAPARPVARSAERRAPSPAVAVGEASGAPPRVALVIDDLGRKLEDLDTIDALQVPIACAVLPFERLSRDVAGRVRARGGELLLHLPMESAQPGENPGPGALRTGMNDAALREGTERALAEVAGAIGINNHMGSALTADRRAMEAVLGVAAARRLFFLDSRTTPHTVAFDVARELGVPALERQVFLDDDLASEAIRAEFRRLLDLAAERGAAIAIGHPHPATFAVLAEEVPAARKRGVRFVTVGELLGERRR